MTHNLASLPTADQDAINADLVACRLRGRRASMGLAAWRQMCAIELAKMPAATAALVREALARRAGK